MRLYRTPPTPGALASVRPGVAAIGTFDGLHLGHQAIVGQARTLAHSNNARSIVVSFEPTPAEFFSRDRPPARLTCFRERAELLCAAELDELFCPRFDSVRAISAEAFVSDLLVGRLGVRQLVIGHDFRFGAGRQGSLAWLQENGARLGVEVVPVSPVELDGERISSTAIRAALAAGRLDSAQAMLGRGYSMSGRVVHGRRLGRDLGFPTANIRLKRRVAPVDGIFAVRVKGLGNDPLDAVSSVGHRPTIGGTETLLEVFIFDFAADIYGQYLHVEFVDRLRGEVRFPDLESMQAQMSRDADAARAALSR